VFLSVREENLTHSLPGLDRQIQTKIQKERKRRRPAVKSENKVEMGCNGQSLGARPGHPDARPSPASAAGDAPPGQTSQAERGVMHPERDDVEWHYWRGGWGRLT
jgi:hypothetical protein